MVTDHHDMPALEKALSTCDSQPNTEAAKRLRTTTLVVDLSQGVIYFRSLAPTDSKQILTFTTMAHTPSLNVAESLTML